MIESIKINTRETPDMYDIFLSVGFFSQPKNISHDSKINSLVMSLSEEVLITTACDGLVKVWGLDGEFLGDLQISGAIPSPQKYSRKQHKNNPSTSPLP